MTSDIVFYLACLVAFYGLMGYACYLCAAAYWKTKRKAWILIFVFCLSSFIGFSISKFTLPFEKDPITELSYEERYEMWKRGDGPKRSRQIHPPLDMSIPLFQFLFVLGLFFITRDLSKQKITEQESESAD